MTVAFYLILVCCLIKLHLHLVLNFQKKTNNFPPSTNQGVASAHAQPSIAWLVGCIASSATRYWVFFCQKAWRTWGHCITTIFLFTSTHTIPKLVSFTTTTTLMHLLLFYAPLKDLLPGKGGLLTGKYPARPSWTTSYVPSILVHMGRFMYCIAGKYSNQLFFAYVHTSNFQKYLSDKNSCWSEIFHNPFSI